MERVKEYMSALAACSGIEMVREEQQGAKLTYPFFSYKILSLSPETEQCRIEQYEETADASIVSYRERRDTAVVVSITFTADSDGYWAIQEAALRAWHWVDSADGVEAAEVLGIGAVPMGDITDRTVFLDVSYEHRLGFDVKITLPVLAAREQDAVDIPGSLPTEG